jgi:glycosyltransferase involved in cell wall biosynthesis
VTTRPQVVIWRKNLLMTSETFIGTQAAALQRWKPRFAALEYTPNDFGVVPDVRADSIDDPALLELLRDSDLVHAHFALDGMEIAPVARTAARPLVITFHGFDVSVRHLYWSPGSRRRLHRLFEQARLLIAVSGFIADRLVALGASRSKIVTHHIGIPIPPDRPDPETGNRRGILFVGRLVEKKGCDDLLAAVAGLPQPLRGTPVTVIGDGPLKQGLERAAKRADLDVDFRGAQSNDEVRRAMRRAALLCAPSKRARNGDAEGLPITILEAAAHRLPVVSTYSSGIPEAIVDGHSGILVPERHRRALRGALETMLFDEGLRARVADAGRQVVEQRFDIVRQTAALEALYDSASSRGA